MRADGSEQRPLTDNRWEEGTPAWVPAAPAGGDGADFRRRFRDEFRGIGIDRIGVVLPGSEPGTYRVVVCEDADEAAACLRGASDDR